MELTEEQKEIIKKIKDRDIIDLYSFVTEYLKPETFKYDSNEIEEKKKNDYEESRHEIDEYLGKVKKTELKLNYNGNYFTHSDYTSDEIEHMKKQMSNYKVNHSDFEKEIKIKNLKFNINTLTSEVYIVDGLYSAILEFFSLWNLLESKQLVLSIPKQVTVNDAKIFFKKNASRDSREYLFRQNSNLSQNSSIDFLKLNVPFDPKFFYKKDDKEYTDVRLSIEKDAITVAENYIDKKILVLPNLLPFVQDDFKTNDEKKYRSEKRRANIAIAVSIVVALISFGLSYFLAADNTNFWEQNENNRINQYEEMNGLLSDINNQLLEINKELKEITIDK